jgi:hypothetical protein
VEDEVLRYLAQIRAAVSGQVADAAGVEGVRAALLRLFSAFTLHWLDAPEASFGYAHPSLLLAGQGGFLIEPYPRAEAILDGRKKVAFPQLRRVSLDASGGISASGR